MGNKLQEVRVVFLASCVLAEDGTTAIYQAIPDVAQQIAQDFSNGREGGMYDVTLEGRPLIIGLRFDRVLRIG